MIKIENVEVVGWEHAIRGMRNPLNSHDKSDSRMLAPEEWLQGFDSLNYLTDVSHKDFKIGKDDLTLMKKLCKAGTDHRKFMRMIVVYMDVTANHTFWSEFDTYKVGTVRNSCSKMHTIHVKEFSADDFDHEGIDEVGGETQLHFAKTIVELEKLRKLFNETKEKKYWRAIIELLPMGYHLKATVMLNYEVITNIYHSRKNHKLTEWRTLCEWIEKNLPYHELITGSE